MLFFWKENTSVIIEKVPELQIGDLLEIERTPFNYDVQIKNNLRAFGIDKKAGESKAGA